MLLLLLPVLLLLLPAFIYLPFAEAPSSVEWRFVVCSCCFRRELKKNEQQQKETGRERVIGRRGRGVQPLGFAPLRTSSSTRALYFETFTAQEETKLTPNGIPYPLLPPTHTPLPIPRTRLSCQLHVDKRPRHGPTSGRQGVAGQCKD